MMHYYEWTKVIRLQSQKICDVLTLYVMVSTDSDLFELRSGGLV